MIGARYLRVGRLHRLRDVLRLYRRTRMLWEVFA